MNPVEEFDRLSASLFIWHRFDSEIKAELFATGLTPHAGVWLVDPFAVDMPALTAELVGREVAGIIVTNENHVRASAAFAEDFQVPIYAHADARAGLISPRVIEVDGDAELSQEIRFVYLEGAAPGEIALHCESEGGTVIIGDALINFGAHGFTFLPAKYCSNPKVLRRSLRKLLDFRFERIFFAHGDPILTRGHARLEALLERAD